MLCTPGFVTARSAHRLTLTLNAQVRAAVDALFTHLSKEQAAKNSLLEEEDIFSLVRTPPHASTGAGKKAAATSADAFPCGRPPCADTLPLVRWCR